MNDFSVRSLPPIGLNPICAYSLPSRLINAARVVLADIAQDVRIFGVTRKNGVPYSSYINQVGRLVSGFLKKSVLVSFSGQHVDVVNGQTIITDLATGEQTIIPPAPQFGYGDIVEILEARWGKHLIWEMGKVINVYSDGWINVLIQHKALRYRANELCLISKAPPKPDLSGVKLTANDWTRVTSWSPYETARRYRSNYQPSKDWDKVSDAELEAAAALARAALGV